MQYTESTPVVGAPETAIKVLRDALIANEFTIRDAKPTEFTATGPGMTSSIQNAIRGVSKATFRVQGGLMQVQAELGGAAWLGRFAIFFPIALGMSLSTIFFFVGLIQPRSGTNSVSLIVPLLSVGPWLVIGPFMARSIRKRTERAMHALMQSAASVSRA